MYDGSDENAQVIDTYSGCTVPSPIVTTGSDIYIAFDSDGSVNDEGFVATYECVSGKQCLLSISICDTNVMSKYNKKIMSYIVFVIITLRILKHHIYL